MFTTQVGISMIQEVKGGGVFAVCSKQACCRSEQRKEVVNNLNSNSK